MSGKIVRGIFIRNEFVGGVILRGKCPRECPGGGNCPSWVCGSSCRIKVSTFSGRDLGHRGQHVDIQTDRQTDR